MSIVQLLAACTIKLFPKLLVPDHLLYTCDAWGGDPV
jgi:hypothetical protein